jgi:hypothetical protein
MLSFADSRSFGSSEERFSRCVFCGKDLVLLPEDRRGGSCYDCLALAIAPPVKCPDCGTMIPGEDRAVGCAECKWYPRQD